MLEQAIPNSMERSLPACEPLERATREVLAQIAGLEDFRWGEIPAELARMTGAYGGKTLDLRASTFESTTTRGRMVRIDGEGTWILNLVAWGKSNSTIPVLGIEVLVFRERAHLLVADVFPLVDEDASLMDSVSPIFDGLGPTPDMPSWAHQIFSRRPIFRKPGATAAIGACGAAVELVGQIWVERVLRERRQPDGVELEQASIRRERYMQAHLDDEPANPFLRKAFGDELGGRLTREILFPRDLRIAAVHPAEQERRS